jgi:hypothetical protein
MRAADYAAFTAAAFFRPAFFRFRALVAIL